jgi:hypothetical protein
MLKTKELYINAVIYLVNMLLTGVWASTFETYILELDK